MTSPVSGNMPKRDMKVLAMGLPRSGTLSMARALEILGYENVFHGMKSIDSPSDWIVLERAADATFKNLPTYTGKPFTRDQWDEVFGASEAATDVASVFGPTLTNVYPDAKVVLVKRDFDKWFKSMETAVFRNIWGAGADFFVEWVEPILGSRAGPGSRKILLGFFQAEDLAEIHRNARMAYDRHHREMHEAVPPGQLLDYKLGDGWEPLCEFLGKPVPVGVEFPHVNENEAMNAAILDKCMRDAKAAGRKLLPWVAGVGAATIGSWMMLRRVDVQ